jgi:hypothetical protein
VVSNSVHVPVTVKVLGVVKPAEKPSIVLVVPSFVLTHAECLRVVPVTVG